MTRIAGVETATADVLGLRLDTLRGTASYTAYVANASDIEAALGDLEEELRVLAAETVVVRLSPADGDQLVAELAATPAELVVVDARRLSAHDWALLDRRRSSIAHRGVLVLVTTPEGFDDLMRQAPNLASCSAARSLPTNLTSLQLRPTASVDLQLFAHGHTRPTKRSSKRLVPGRCRAIPSSLNGWC